MRHHGTSRRERCGTDHDSRQRRRAESLVTGSNELIESEQEIGLLFRGPGVPDIRTEEEVEFGWFSALSDFQLTEAFVNENQVAIIDIVAVDDDGEPIEVPAEALRDAIAQLVYTATGLPEDDAVRAVRIRIDGQAATLPTEGGDSEEVLDRSDFETYDPDFVPPVATAPPTTTTPDPDAGDGDS